MKVLLLTIDFFSKGGIQRYSRYQYKALVDLYGKDKVFVFSLLPKQQDNMFEEDINVEYVGQGMSSISKLQYFYNVLKLTRKEKIDLIICTHVQLSIIAFLAKKIYGVKYMTNVYGLEIWSGLKRRDITGLLNSDKLIGDCNFILNYISNNFTYEKNKMELLYDPVDTNIFKPKEKNQSLFEKYKIPNDKFILSTIGRLERNKGHEILIKTLKELSNDIIYVVVGGGKYDLQFKELTQKENVESRVFFVGRVPEDELVDFYNLADVVVLLSTFGEGEGEGLPLGLIEAAACGKPIIAGNQDGSVDAISSDLERQNGFLIDPLSSSALKEVINTLLNNEILCKKLGQNSAIYIHEKFEFNKFKAKMKEIIENEIC